MGQRMIFDSIVNHVPIESISYLIQSNARRSGEVFSSVPHRTTVEQMARELDSIADVKSADLAMETKN